MSLMATHGRGGDIIMSMSAASLIREKTGVAPVIAVGKSYGPVADLMLEMGMPVSDVVMSPHFCPVLDNGVFGSSVSRWSCSMLRFLYGHDENYNCCLGSVPSGVHLCSLMRYLTGLTSSLSLVSMPRPSESFRHVGGSSTVVYHFGGSSVSKFIHVRTNPYPEMTAVFAGARTDPMPSWGDVDMRGASLSDLCLTLREASACVGSDSLVTHISSLMEVPTVALHASSQSISMSDRKYSPRGHSVLYNEGEKVSVEVIDLLSRYMS